MVIVPIHFHFEDKGFKRFVFIIENGDTAW